MSQLRFMENLLNGVKVEWKPLGNLAEIKRGTSITKKNVIHGEIPVIAGGRTPAYFHNVSNRNGQIIVIAGSGAYAGFVSWWEQPVFVSDAFTIKPYDELLPKYCYYWLQNMQQHLYGLQSDGGVPHVYPRGVAPLRIPTPPIEIQAEIVRILNTFTELTAELTAELNARRKQYTYYRDQLLTFEKSAVKWRPMKEIGEFIRGKRFTKADYVDDGGISVIHYGEIYTKYGVSTAHALSRVRDDLATSLRYSEPGDVIITDVGETVEDVGKAVAWLGGGKVAIHDHCYAFRHPMNPKFVSYYMQTSSFIREKGKYVARTKVKTLLIKGFSKISIPVPPIEEQNRIVAILDKFDTLTNSISAGLPREIELRQKQYEYYRDLLLSFPKPEEVA